jgi:hypothetical protein
MKKISCLLSLLLILAPIAHVAAQTQTNFEHVKKNVAKLGVGSKAKGTINLKNDTKVKGYVYSAGDEDFVMRDSKTDSPTTIRYAEVLKVDDHRGHRNSDKAFLIVVLGAGIALAAIIGSIAANER